MKQQIGTDEPYAVIEFLEEHIDEQRGIADTALKRGDRRRADEREDFLRELLKVAKKRPE